MQVTLSVNQYGIIDSIPELINLQRYIEVYLDHNIDVIKREYAYECDKATQRLEIVLGLTRAISILDDVIHEIRGAKSTLDAISSLKQKFSFTDLQAQAITDMRLGKLANTEIDYLIKEQGQLNKTIDDCTKILNSEKAQKKELLKRLDAFVEAYRWDRRTEVCDMDLANEKITAVAKTRIIENYTVVLETNGNIKCILTSQYKAAKKVNYLVTEIAEDQKLLLISNKGLLYKIAVKQIPKASLNSIGTPVSNLITLQSGENIIQILNGFEPENYVFFVTKRGLAKKTPYQDLCKLSKNIGATVMKVAEDDEIILSRLLESEKIRVMYNNKEKIIDTDKFISKSRTAGGVTAIKVKSGNYVSVI